MPSEQLAVVAQGFIEAQLEATMNMSILATTWMNSRMGELRTKLKEAEEKVELIRAAEGRAVATTPVEGL